MKYIGWVMAIIFAAMFTHSSLKEEGEELNYVMNSMSFLIEWSKNQDYRIACHEESEISQEKKLLALVK